MVNGQSHVALPSARRRGRVRAIASTLPLAIGLALAAPGNLDPGFRGSGLLSFTISDFGGNALAVIQQSDGKLVFAGVGTLKPDDGGDFVALRVAADGTPDSTFGAGGIGSADFAGHDDIAVDVIQQTDGKLVLAGTTFTTNGSQDIALARFNANGTPDVSFGDGGKATLDIGGSHDFARGLIQQSGGKLVIAGEAISGGRYHLVFARFNADGILDPTFGTGGTTIVDFGGGSESFARDFAQQSDGKLVAVGTVSGPVGSDFGIVRVTANGALDASFDSDGMLTVDITGSVDQAHAVAIQSDDAIVAAGCAVPLGGDTCSAAMLRVNGDGSLDDGFGAAGKAVVALGRNFYLNSIVVETDGKLVATGTLSTDVGREDMILARFNADGALDTTYGIGGVATVDFGERDIAPYSSGVALIRQVDGKYVAAGPNSVGSFGAARFDDDAGFPGRIGLTVTSQNVSETAATVTCAVRRTGGMTGAVSVDYATAAGGAQPGSDFEAASGTLSWNDGDASDRTLVVNLVNDTAAEADEDFSLTLSTPTGGAQLAATDATTIIASEDGPGQLRFLFPLDPYQVSEFDFFGDGAVWIRVPVQRTGGSTGAVSVTYSTANGTATAGADYQATSGTLNWADGDRSVRSIEVAILDDQAAEGREEFQIRLSDPTGGATIPTLLGTQVIVILDNESGFGFSSTAATVGETGDAVLLSVSRSGAASGAASVNYSTSSGSATSGFDFTSTSGTLNWADGDTASKKISVNITNDSTDEIDETFVVTLSNPSGGAPLGSNSTATVTIVDDDAPVGGGGGSSGGGGSGSGGGAFDWIVVLFLLTRFAFGSRLRERYPIS